MSTLKELKDVLQVATACGMLDDLQSFCKSPNSINDVCDAVDQMMIAHEAAVMPEHLHQFYYFDVAERKVYKVIAIPQIQTKLMRVYDVGRSPDAYYLVAPERLGRTEREAIRIAKDDIKDARLDVRRQREELREKDEELTRFMGMCEGGGGPINNPDDGYQTNPIKDINA